MFSEAVRIRVSKTERRLSSSSSVFNFDDDRDGLASSVRKEVKRPSLPCSHQIRTCSGATREIEAVELRFMVAEFLSRGSRARDARGEGREKKISVNFSGATEASNFFSFLFLDQDLTPPLFVQESKGSRLSFSLRKACSRPCAPPLLLQPVLSSGLLLLLLLLLLVLFSAPSSFLLKVGSPPPSSLLRKRGDPIEKKTQSINPLYFTTNPIPQPLLAAPSRLQAQPDAPLSSCELQAEKRARKVRKHGGRETICFFSFSSDVFFSFANHLSRPPPPPNYNEQSAGPGSSAASSRPSCGSTRPRGSSETFSSSEKRAVRWLLRAPLLLPPTTASLS